MPAKFAVQIKKPRDITRRVFNGIVRKACLEGAKFWLAEYLMKHFEAGARSRYGFTARSARTKKLKQYSKRLRNSKKELVTTPKPPRPLVMSGELEKELRGRPLSAYNIKATATAKRQRIKVPIRLPHPMQEVHAAEIVATNEEERNKLKTKIADEIKRRMKKLRSGSRYKKRIK